MNKDENICGITKEIHYDKKIKNLNVELAIDKIGCPILIFEDWTNKKKPKELLRLHIQEAVELKSTIDNLNQDYLITLIERSKEETMESFIENYIVGMPSKVFSLDVLNKALQTKKKIKKDN